MTSRRDFLALSAAAVFLRRTSHAATPFPVVLRQAPPYQALLGMALPGTDEFPGEKAALEIESALLAQLRSGSLPLENPRVRYEAIAADVERGVFGTEGAPWLDALGVMEAARFFVLPENTVRYEIKSRAAGKWAYRVGHGRVTWTQGHLERFELQQEVVTSAGQPWFRDVTGSLFADCPSFQEQLARGIPYWRARLDPATGIDIYGSQGLAVGDIDNDGWDEIYVCQPGGLPNRLYKNLGHGRLRDITEGSGLDLLDDTSCALFVDWRNSGRQDVVVLRSSGPLLFLNQGHQRFEPRPDAFRFATAPKGSFTGMAAADYDRDGKLDLYLCTYSFFQSEAQYRYPSPYHDARNGPPNFLFRNRLDTAGQGFFEDVTAAAGMDHNNNRFSFAPAWCDYKGDGWPALYVANDFGRNNLYQNNHGHFEDRASAAGVEDMGPGMSAAWFDYDGDGRPDLHTSNMWTAAGLRLVRDPNFQPSKGLPEPYRRHTKGNSLYRNSGDGTFTETGAAEGVEMGRWAWASGGFDWDGDGSPEILTTCGMLSNISPNDLSSFFWRQVVAHSPQSAVPAAAYENGWNAINQLIREDYGWNGNEPNVVYARRKGRYYDFSGVSGLDAASDGRAFAVTDLDGDGRPDLLVKNRLGPQLRAFQNNRGGDAGWIAFDLTGTKSNRDAVGARVNLDGQMQFVHAGSGYLSQHSKRLHFGLRGAAQANKVEIVWPSGARQHFEALDAGYRYRITEGVEHPERIAFAARQEFAAPEIHGIDNVPRLHTTWFWEPVPLPERRTGPGLLTISAGMLEGKPELAAWYALFRRYLFDYRKDLEVPLHLLIDAESRACKIYAEPPDAAQVRNDLAVMQDGPPERKALLFAGRYASRPHRDYFKLGVAFYWAGYPRQALPYLAETLRRSPDNERVLLAMGQIHLQLGQPEQAKPHLERAAAINPSNAEIWNELGGVAAARGDAAGALALYRKAIGCDPNSPYALLNAAQALAQAGQNGEAETLFRRALAADPRSADAANGLGLLLAGSERLAESKQMFLRAIELQPDHASAINNLGVLYMKMGQTNDAIAAFEYGVRTLPLRDELYMNLGRAYLQAGAPEKARETMQRLLAKAPDNQAARNALRALEPR
ncbi:MAG TPA: hypothetical protein DEQ47_18145 [Solibacterales bacterium]|nr:hypothetical protein [Bryobacterales bacterium]